MSVLTSGEFWAFVGVVAGIYTILTLGLQIEFGYAGLLNFGHVAFMAIGSYTMAILVVKSGWSMWLAAPTAVVASAASGVLLGLATLRLRADYFAIVTIALSEIVRYVATNEDRADGRIAGHDQPRGRRGGVRLQRPVAAVPGLGPGRAPRRLEGRRDASARLGGRSRAHRARGAVDPDSPGAASCARSGRTRTRLARSARTSSRTSSRRLRSAPRSPASPDCFYAWQFAFFSPADFAPLLTFFAWMILILGGVGRAWAVPVGALVFGVIFAGTRFFEFAPFTWFDSAERAYLRLMVIGLVLIGLMLFRPQGLLGKREELVLE